MVVQGHSCSHSTKDHTKGIYSLLLELLVGKIKSLSNQHHALMVPPGQSYFFPISFHQCYPSVSLLHSYFSTCSPEKAACNCTLMVSCDSKGTFCLYSTHISCTSGEPVFHHLQATTPAKTAFHRPMTFSPWTSPFSVHLLPSSFPFVTSWLDPTLTMTLLAPDFSPP